MDNETAVDALSALAHPKRLALFRFLMRYGPAGLPAGEIAAALDISPSTLSFHLAHLRRAGLLQANRQRRQIFYAISVDRTRALLAYLTEDCCAGHPALCQPEAGALERCATGLEDTQ